MLLPSQLLHAKELSHSDCCNCCSKVCCLGLPGCRACAYLSVKLLPFELLPVLLVFFLQHSSDLCQSLRLSNCQLSGSFGSCCLSITAAVNLIRVQALLLQSLELSLLLLTLLLLQLPAVDYSGKPVQNVSTSENSSLQVLCSLMIFKSTSWYGACHCRVAD